MNGRDETGGFDSLGSLFTHFTHHVVVPAAVIAMVASLLFYLVDVRSAFLGGGSSLKWIGFCFAVATVLIERYRIQGVMGDADLQGCYTAALLGATVLVMLVAPWEDHSAPAGERLANLLIIGAVWRFATGVTRGLSPEADRPSRPQHRLYGLERLRIEAWQRQREAETGLPGPLHREKPRPVPSNPSVAVARLAGIALLAFALGEPILLNAAPQTGVRAQAAVVVFLFATGVVLAAGSALDTLRRAERAGAQVAAGVVPRRLALAGALLLVVLIASLAMPGVHSQGSGRLRPPTAQGEEQDGGDPASGKTETPGQRPPQEQGDGGSQGRRQSPRGEGRSSRAAAVLGGPAGALLNLLGRLARWLIVPLVLALILGGLWALVRLWPHLGGWWGRLTGRLRELLARLAGFFAGPPRKAREETQADPLADLEHLSLLPPREAVLASYQRFLALLNVLGHPRPERTTPYELLQILPRHLRRLEEPARSLTDLYIQAAYAPEPVEPGAREQAILALRGMKGLLEATETQGAA